MFSSICTGARKCLSLELLSFSFCLQARVNIYWIIHHNVKQKKKTRSISVGVRLLETTVCRVDANARCTFIPWKMKPSRRHAVGFVASLARLFEMLTSPRCTRAAALMSSGTGESHLPFPDTNCATLEEYSVRWRTKGFHLSREFPCTCAAWHSVQYMVVVLRTVTCLVGLLP